MVKARFGQQGPSTENKSQAIRDYLAAHPTEGPTAVAKALTAQTGMDVNAGYVSTIKNKLRPKRRRGKGVKKAAQPAEARVMSSLIQAKRFAEQIGGVSKAKDALDRLSKLVD